MSNFSTSTQQDEDENSCCESDEEFIGRKKMKKKLLKKSDNTTNDCVININVNESSNSSNCIGTVSLTPMQSYNEERMKRRLQFFFMNPIEKWKAKRRFPYKFVIQLIKIVLVTIQLCLFAHSRYNHVNYTWDNKVTFSHLFLKGWDSNMEVSGYPPSFGPLAIYLKDNFYTSIDYAIDGYSKLNQSIGSYSYLNEDNSMSPIRLCFQSYKEGDIFGFNESYIFNPDIDITCFNLTNNITQYGTKKFLQLKEMKINFSSLVQATLEFGIKTVNFKAAGPIAPPDCYQFNVMILFDNRDHDGQMLLSLDAEPIRLHCKGNVEYVTDSEIDDALRSMLNMFVIIVCLVSFILCARALYNAQILRKQTVKFFKTNFNRDLNFDDQMEFLNIWYIMIICNDVLLIIGSALKEQIERKHFTTNEWNTCSLFLGIGNLLVWFGVLRYLGFFKTYNVVILTLKRAAPKISRFLICALLIYAGFTFCGWLVLGPYHIKFRSLATTAECLFSLINGDDMFATFATVATKSTVLWWFSRIYLYTFISLYIYVVLSLFISVIMDAYDTIKHYYKEGFPTTELKSFIGTMNQNDLSSGVFRDDETCSGNALEFFHNICCACWRRREPQNGPTGYTTISSGSV